MKDHIVLCPNAHRDIGLQHSIKLQALFAEHGHEAVIAPFLSSGTEETWPKGICTYDLTEVLENARLLITLGGDGTILQISRYLGGTGIPILGINLGNKGFLTEIDGSQYEQALIAAEGSYSILPRMMLDIRLIRDGEVVYEGKAINEAVVRSLVSTIRVEAFGDGNEILDFSGDGIIVSSPTGSTAYSMSAGGPIVEPESSCIILTPICAFRLAARSFVLSDKRLVLVRTVDQGEKKVALSIDGEPVDFLPGDELLVSRSEDRLLMARINEKSFYTTVFEKLNDKSEIGGSVSS